MEAVDHLLVEGIFLLRTIEGQDDQAVDLFIGVDQDSGLFIHGSFLPRCDDDLATRLARFHPLMGGVNLLQ